MCGFQERLLEIPRGRQGGRLLKSKNFKKKVRFQRDQGT